MSSDINCSVKFLKNELEISSHNIILRNYKNRDVFQDFKNNLLKVAITNKDDTIKLVINNEEHINFYISRINSGYLVEVYKVLDNGQQEYLETLKYRNKRLYYRRDYRDDYYYFVPFLTLPLFCFLF